MNSGSVGDVIGWLAARRVEGVVMPGYVDRTLCEEEPFFSLDNTSLYLETDAGLLCIDDRRFHGRLRLSVTDSLAGAREKIDAVIDHDEGEEFLPISLAAQFLTDGRDFNTLTRARYVLSESSRPEDAVVDCLELVFDDCCCLFVEPTWDGLVTGSHGSYEHWAGHLRSRTMDQRRETVWAAPARRPLSAATGFPSTT
ncbi:hypothetical protein HNR23_000681 [Nocardiopsis mwathae]|uniref:Uncharacterized protein n=1 Tax=Nocardiopsis mwathae TaxID=1472723 RepID=A0A7W9YG24_9ACTN|nr:hypothetical protein [Nocardiopsis mwathae]MBB6170621.1 hypothetical protein [Nocardiopsis mwathae]